MAVCGHRHRLHQTTCIETLLIVKKLRKNVKSLFAESGIGVPSYRSYVIIIPYLSRGVKFFFEKMCSEFCWVSLTLYPTYVIWLIIL